MSKSKNNPIFFKSNEKISSKVYIYSNGDCIVFDKSLDDYIDEDMKKWLSEEADCGRVG